MIPQMIEIMRKKARVIRSIHIIVVLMVRTQSTSVTKLLPGCLAIPAVMTPGEIRLSEPLSSSCLPAYHPSHGFSARRQGGLWFTKQTLTSEAHLNCNYTLVMTFYNLWWEGDGTLDSVLETKRKTRRREGNRMLIMF